MSEDIYAKPDLTKKVRFQKDEGGNKDESDINVKDDVDSVRIYDNRWTEENSPPKVEDTTTENQQQINSVDVNSEKRHHVKAVLLLMGLLCFLLLVTVIVLVCIIIVGLQESYRDLERLNLNLTRWNRLLEEEKTNLTIDRDQLQAMNTNLTIDRDQLQAMNTNLTIDRDQLQAMNTNLTEETDELHKQLRKTLLCPEGMWRFNNSWYFISNSKNDWTKSKAACERLDATLAIISTEQEQSFISSLNKNLWIGLTDEEEEDVWKWVNGDEVTTMYWRNGQPDNYGSKEHCAQIEGNGDSLKNWNDLTCWTKMLFICEKKP